MADKREQDPVTKRDFTGHEWDGIKELNTPIPRWWVMVFLLTILFSAGYWIAYPAWPTISGYTHGALGWSSRAALSEELQKQQAARSGFVAKIAATPLDQIMKDHDLLTYARTGGEKLFNDTCAACHGVGGVGRKGAYPALDNDVWTFGGTLEQIKSTITHGVRNDDPESKGVPMPEFGASGILTPEQIREVATYVVSLQGAKAAESLDKADMTAGQHIFADNCVACHGEGGVGNPDMGAPPLNTKIRTFTESTITGVSEQVYKPHLGSMPSWSHRFDEPSLKMLAIYVYTLGGGLK